MVANKKSKVISFWSRVGNQNGITVNITKFAFSIAKLFPNKSILLIDTNFQFAFLQEYLGTTSNNKNLDTLIDLQTVGALTKETFCECLNEINELPNLYSVNSSKNNVFNNLREMQNSLNEVIDMAIDIFDFVLIDNISGISEVSNIVNKKADLVISFMKLNRYLLDSMNANNYLEELKDKKKYINIFNMYRKELGFSMNDIKKNWDLENIDYIPYDDELDYHINSGTLKKYLLEERDEQTEIIITKIMQLLEIECEIEKEQPKRKSLKILFGIGR